MTDHDQLAAEYALGLLEGEELLRARGMEAHDADFAAAVARWQGHLGPLLDEVPADKPRADLWQDIEAALEGEAASSDTVVSLEASLRRWKWATGASAAAAALVLAVLLAQPLQTVPTVPATPLAASIPVGDTGLRLEVTYVAEQKELLVSAAGLAADGVHDHELWVVTDTGAKSLGVVTPGAIKRMALDEALAAQLIDGADLVLTREPLGGAPQGGEAGPVVASGEFAAL